MRSDAAPSCGLWSCAVVLLGDAFAADFAVLLRVVAFFEVARFVVAFLVVARFAPRAVFLADFVVLDVVDLVDRAAFAVFDAAPSESVVSSTLAAEFFCSALIALFTARLSL